MTVQWGSWDFQGANGMRVGIDVASTAVVNTSANVVFTVSVYTQNQNAYSADAQTLTYVGNISGTKNYTDNEAGGAVVTLRDTLTDTFTYSTFGSSPGNRTYTATVSGAVNGSVPTQTVVIPIPPRPVSGPAVPTGVVLTRNTDTSATMTWTPHPTGAQPYTSQTIQARFWYQRGGFTGFTDWYTTAIVDGPATSFFKNFEFSANSVWQQQIRADNNSGSSSFVSSNVIFMTPAAPSSVVSKLSTSGASITTTWTDNSYNYPGVGTWTIQRSVAGGAFVNVGTVGTKTPTSFTDSSPGAGTNQYRVAAVAAGLQSAYATGNTVSGATGTPPAAPTLLSPNGSSVDFVNNNVVFTWQFNPGGTGAAQTHFTIEKSVNSGSTWTALGSATDVASSVSSFTLPAGTLVNGTPYLWRVRTEGIVATGYGPNSASASVIGSTRPVATLSSPPGTTSTFQIVATWAYAQAELSPQTAYKAALLDSTGTLVLQEIDGFDSTNSVSFTYVPTNGLTYIVAVQVQSGAGVWSNVAQATTVYNLLPPAQPILSGEYQECTGTVLVHLAPGVTVPGVTVDTASVTIERSVNQGDWVTLGTGILIPTDFLDILPVTNGLNQYRITATSFTPSTVQAPILSVPGTDGLALGDPLWVWITYGDNFEFVLRVHGNLSLSEVGGRVKAQQHFLGRPKPVALVGANTNRSVTLTGSLFWNQFCVPVTVDSCLYDTEPSLWIDAGENSEVVCYRDFTGRRIFGTISDVQITDQVWPGKAAVSFGVTEVDFTERYVQLVTA